MAKKLWEPSKERIENSNMKRFMDFVNDKHGTHFTEYAPLYDWSIENIPDLWAAVWEFTGVKASRPFDSPARDLDKMPGTEWFPGARLNFAENLLRYRDDRPAIVSVGEEKAPRRMTYAQLYDEAARLAESLKNEGVGVGDRVAGFMPNILETVAAMLAAASLGAVWSSCSPDFGIKGALDRFGQIRPKVIFAADGYFFKGKKISSLERVADIRKKLPSLKKLVVVPYADESPDISGIDDAVFYNDFKSDAGGLEMDFAQLPFSHPIYIMYSSGTTGLPKCMVQSAGGILLNHSKELWLHTDLRKDDVIFYFTTCGWMMWNWLVTSLATGACVVLFDGNPFHPHPGRLWEIAESEKINVFGTSAGYLAALQASGEKPGEKYDLSPLKSVMSTGSPLSIEGFDFVYEHIKGDVQLASISGGTDLNGCFALGDPTGPVYAGELQCRGLGMSVKAYDDNGKSVVGSEGELVCEAPFPSMPVYFWDDPDRARYHAAYFDVYPGVWRHGDYVEITPRGGLVMRGRSDSTLNPGGVRIGTAEIYRRVEQIDEIEDSVVVGQDWKNDIRVILFVKMAGGSELTDELRDRIKRTIRANASPRHVPAKIIAVPDVPYTLNMKKVEVAVKKIIHGKPVTNKDALKNPEALDFFENIPELDRD
ncbi:Acetoacetyl-coenzyme A synthetase [Candidatus Desulfarcum epimagneticum]|uniref:Acetoacetyl-coenzyme A synthetase n=1 Tax=uncultured Desulfobacteraceae bacterium TaxID=218296 RepID=A0A484HM62_9BACT|nr:Acetoacetyl-coenzyme A synthetase [uncultured Desulfobacteraceae bacterium]